MSAATATSKCALYCRVSTVNQDCELQLRELREFCQRRGFPIVGEYIDTGISAAKVPVQL